jgi:hypothetical protein
LETDESVPTSGTFILARRLFAAAFGVVFLCAFVSLGVQVRGLFGEHGIMPATEFLLQAGKHLGSGAIWQVPSLFWIDASDGMLVGFCIAGAILSCGIIAGVAPGACAFACWALYLSLCSVGSPFLDFQWDILLLETALLAAFWLPWRPRPAWTIETSGQQFARWLLWWLLFRLMFESGVVKLAWGDKTWWELRALEYHFETQPLPLWTAWYAHQVPAWLLRGITLVTFFVEMGAPFLLIAPRRWRHAAGIALAGLQIGILLTGNYAFFNWLSLALCLLVFDDRFFPQRWRERLPAAPTPAWPAWRIGLALAGTTLAFVLSLPGFFNAFDLKMPSPLAQFRSFNGYGLFRVMTTERPEVVIEGSNDGVTWNEYEFPWKPGDVRRAPGLVAPHQPRVDWQMWFAALGDVRANPWFVNLLAQTLQGSPQVLDFYAWNPFPNQPPRSIRAVLYDYHFTRAGESGWWRRERRGLYCPPISLSREPR